MISNYHSEKYRDRYVRTYSHRKWSYFTMRNRICISIKSESNRIEIHVQLSFRVWEVRRKLDEIRTTYTRFIRTIKSSNVLCDWYETWLLKCSSSSRKSSLFDLSRIWNRSITINSHVTKYQNVFVYIYRTNQHRTRIYIKVVFKVIIVACDNTHDVIEHILLHRRYFRRS